MASAAKPRIGVVLANIENESFKEDLIDFTRRVPHRPWLKHVRAEHRVHRKPYKGSTSGKRRGHMDGCPLDVSIATYIASQYGTEFEIDYIGHQEITEKRLKSNDINFFLIYDLLEAYNYHYWSKKDKLQYGLFRDALEQCPNVFPSFEYQKFINSKITYYNHLKEQGIPLLPTLTIYKQQWLDRVEELVREHGKKNAALHATREVIAEIHKLGMTEYICKPELGQEARGFKAFHGSPEDEEAFRAHLDWLFNHEGYPGVIVQELIPGFGKTKASPELRMYFVGDRYMHSIYLHNFPGKKGMVSVRALDDAGGEYEVPSGVDMNVCKALAHRTFECLPPVVLGHGENNVELPKLMTRIDVGCMRHGIFDPWVNEVEFVPSWFPEFHRFPVDSLIGEQMAVITKQFMRKRGFTIGKRKSTDMKRPVTARFAAKKMPLSIQGWKRTLRTPQRKVVKFAKK